MKNFAHLNETSPFYPFFPHGLVPIKNWIVPQVGEMLGDGVREFYMVDVAKLTPEQIGQVATFVAGQCGGTPQEVEEHMRKQGELPLRRIHVTAVSSDSMAFL